MIDASLAKIDTFIEDLENNRNAIATIGQETLKAYEKWITETTRALAEAQRDLNCAREDQSRCHNMVSHDREVLAATEAELEELKRQVRSIEQDIAHYNSEIASLQVKSGSLTPPSRGNLTNEQFSQKQAEHDAEVDLIRRQIRATERERDNEKAQKKQKEDRIAALTAHRTRILEALQQLAGLGRMIDDSIRMLQEYIGKLVSSGNTLTCYRASCHERFSRINAQLRRVKEKADNAATSFRMACECLDRAAGGESHIVYTDNVELSQDGNSLRAICRALQSHRTRVGDDLFKLRSQVESYRRALQDNTTKRLKDDFDRWERETREYCRRQEESERYLKSAASYMDQYYDQKWR